MSEAEAAERRGMVARGFDSLRRSLTGENGAGPRLPSLRKRKPQEPTFKTSSDLLDHYVAGVPSAQNAIDAVPGWIGSMPPGFGTTGGVFDFWLDPRISWLTSVYDCAGKTACELGPLEGFHTHMLQQAGTVGIDAIEANALAFVRCLITKEILKVDRASFYLGDFMQWLEATDKRYDLIVASGVLYHSHDPVRLLELMAAKADALFLWTHYFDEEAMPAGDLRRGAFSGSVETRACQGVDVRLHERSYYKAWRDPRFCGGLQDRHFWIDRADILGLLAALGFDRVIVGVDEPAHEGGPCFSLFAERSPPVAEAEAVDTEPVDMGSRPGVEA